MIYSNIFFSDQTFCIGIQKKFSDSHFLQNFDVIWGVRKHHANNVLTFFHYSFKTPHYLVSILQKCQWSIPLTLQKFGMCGEIICLEKRFKICHILYVYTKTQSCFFHFSFRAWTFFPLGMPWSMST